MDLDTHPLVKILQETGEVNVRLKLAQNEYGGPGTPGHAVASEWLRLKDEGRALVASAKRDARETRTLRLAMWANIIAITALIIAAIAGQKEIWSLIIMILQWFGFKP